MINLIKKDMVLTYSNRWIFLMLILIIPFMIFMVDDIDANALFMYSSVTFVLLTSRLPFSYDIKDQPHLFIQSLPVTKSNIVISKYLSIFINFTIALIFTFLYLLVLNVLGFLDIRDISYQTVIFSLAVNLFSLSISMPTNFIFNPKVSNLINMFIYIGILNIFVTQQGSLLRFINLFTDYRFVVGLIIVALYFLSMGISILLYRNRKFY